jgi:hypothetical protein
MWRFYLSLFILLFSLFACCFGIYYAIHFSHCDADAGRGGALATALALGYSFLGRVHTTKILEFHLRYETDATPMQTHSAAASLLNALKSDARAKLWQDVFTATTVVVGTLVWGGGDIIAQHALHHHCS